MAQVQERTNEKKMERGRVVFVVICYWLGQRETGMGFHLHMH
jgi:hypothetical protein